MTCSCRTAPWRAFLSGLAQVHRLDSKAAQPAFRAWSRASLPRPHHRDVPSLHRIRGFHSTRQAAQEASAAAPAAEPTTPSPATASAVSEGVVESTSTVQKPKKKKERWRDMDEADLAAKKEAKKQRQVGKQKKKEEGKDADVQDKKKQSKKQSKAPYKPRKTTKSPKTEDGTAPVVEKKGFQTIRRKDGITISTRSTAKPGAASDRFGKPKPHPGRNSFTSKRQQPPAPVDPIETLPKNLTQRAKDEQWPDWRIQKEALKAKFPEGWKPRKRLSPDALAGIRALHAQYPDVYTTPVLSQKFELDPEAIRRILKSNWQPTEEEEQNRLERWHNRGRAIWERKAALGTKPPTKWRKEGIARDPSWHEWRKRMSEQEREREQEEVESYQQRREAGKQASSLQARMAGKVL